MNQETRRDIIIFLVVIVSAFLIYQNKGGADSNKDAANTLALREQEKAQVFFEDLSIEAKSGYVWDVSRDKVIFDRNSKEQLPLASITKIMTAIVAKENFDEGNKGFQKEKLGGLMTAMLVESNNEAASTIAQTIETSGAISFVGQMNKKAGELGLDKTIFSNPTGLDLSNSSAGAYGSAEEVAKLLVYGYQKYPDVFGITKNYEVDVDGKTIINKDELVKKFPNIMAGKTGLTNLAGGNLALLFGDTQHMFAIVVLGSSERGRFDDVEKLIGAITKYLQP